MWAVFPLLFSLTSGYILLPTYHQVPLVAPPLRYLLPQQPILLPPSPSQESVSTLDPTLKFSAKPNLTGRANIHTNIPFITRLPNPRYGGAQNIDLCYFLGEDIFTSHVRCNENWADGTNEGVKRYINELTYQANLMIGESNFKLVWKGPYVRSASVGNFDVHRWDWPRVETALRNDVFTVAHSGCDAVIFLLFNEFSEDCASTTTGHKYGGKSYGGMCEVPNGMGHAIVVDQGFLDSAWTGPQILAHHILRMLISDLPDKTCPASDSLLNSSLDPGHQRVDSCVVNKLSSTRVTLRDCLQD